MNLKSIKRFILAAAIGGASGMAMAQDGFDEGFAVDSHILMDFSTYNNAGVDGGIGFQLGARPVYFFHKNVGAFAGIDYANRKAAIENFGSKRLGWIEIPVGVAFRYSMNESMVNGVGLGVYYAKSLTDTINDTPGLNFPTQSSSFGALLTTSTLFKISPTFLMGLQADFKFNFSALSSTPNFAGQQLSIGIGLASRLNF